MKIYVVGSSRNRFLPLNNIREKFLIDKSHDGDNIDNLNPWYCELTGLYYLWKHVDDDIVGLEHYRRYFVNKHNKILSEQEINNLLNDNDILTIYARYSKTNPCKNWLIRNGKWNDMRKFLIFIKCYTGEDYYNVCNKFLNGEYHCLGNMFIAKKDVINEYCEFIFDLLEKYCLVEKENNRQLPRRICGYFTEFLFGAWINYHNKKNKFIKMRMTH